MPPICGDQVVAEIRKFNKDLFIILLTGHKSVAPPIKTIRDLDIQAYYEKSDRFDQLELLVESCVKSIKQMRTIKNYRNGLSNIVDSLPKIYQTRELEPMMDGIIASAANFMEAKGASLEINAAALNTGRTESVIRLTGDTPVPPSMDVLFSEGAFSASPVIFREPWAMAAVYNGSGAPLGLMCVNTASAPRDDRMQPLDVFARQVSAAMENYALNATIHAKNNELTQAYAQLKDGYLEVIDALRLLVDAKDFYTRGHSDRVSDCAVAIAAAMGMNADVE
jgi:HD-GYP domain-containing protein (c-di-GMP phosphodiesterase class II)